MPPLRLVNITPPKLPSNRGPRLSRVCSLTTEQEGPKAGYIVIVNDDSAIRHSVADYFEERNIPVNAVSDRHNMQRYLTEPLPSLIILDWNLGQDDGLDILREIRSYSEVPIIITAEDRCDDLDRIVSLELGADHYITKPFNLRELLARARAVWRRQEIGRLARFRIPERGGYRFNGWQLERQGRRLTYPDGNTIALTKGEYCLLVAFLESPRRCLTREQLLRATRNDKDIFDRSIDVQVLRLRRKLVGEATASHLIQTERGTGYIFTVPVEAF